jgi:hypothetical protein
MARSLARPQHHSSSNNKPNRARHQRGGPRRALDGHTHRRHRHLDKDRRAVLRQRQRCAAATLGQVATAGGCGVTGRGDGGDGVRADQRATAWRHVARLDLDDAGAGRGVRCDGQQQGDG